MTSNRSFFNLQRELIRRNIILPVLSGVGFFFALPLLTLMMIQSKLNYYLLRYTEIETEKFINEFVRDNLLSTRYDGVKVGIIIMATLAGIMLFRYLHNRKQVDFFHSLPISRGNLFIQLYLTGFLSVIPLYIIMYLLAIICAFAMGAGSLLTAGLIFKTIIINILFFLLFYSLAVLATILTGNTFVAIVIYALLNSVIFLTTTIISELFSYWFDTYVYISILDNIGLYSFPLYLYFYGSNMFNTIGDVKYLSTQTFIGIVIAIIVLIILSYVLFKIRKSERAGSSLAFYKTKAPLKCYLVLIAGYLLMFMFSSIAGASWRYVGIVFGIILSHMVLEALYNFDIHSLFKNWKTMIALLIVGVGFFTIMKADIIGYDSKLPNKENITGVSINTYYNGSKHFSSNISNFDFLTSTENIENVYNLAEYAVKNLDNVNYNQDDFYLDENTTSLLVKYTLKNGNEMIRRYLVPISDEFDSYLEAIILTDDYKQHEFNSVFSLDLDSTESIEVYINRSIYNDNITGVVTDTKESFEIIEAIKEESLTLTKEQAENTVPLLNIDFEVEYKRDYNYIAHDTSYGDYIDSVPVYPTYTKTLALISKYYDFTPQSITVDDISRIDITKYPDDTELLQSETSDSNYYTVAITDKETIAKLIENSIPHDIAICASPLLKLDETPLTDISVVFNSQNSTPIYYLEGTAPLELINQLI